MTPISILHKVRIHYSQWELATILKKDVQTIRRWETWESEVPSLAILALKEILLQNNSKSTKNILTFIDLFAWIWWIKIGFENAGFECVFSNDFDKTCKTTFDYNFAWILDNQHSLVLWDMRNISSDSIPQMDILTWGFPCQPFSIAWYKKGFDDWWRWDLFFDIVRILRDKKPKAFLLENVKNLKSHDKWTTLKIIYNALEKLGYLVTGNHSH